MLARILYTRTHITTNGGDDPNCVTVWLTTQSPNRIPLIMRKVVNGLEFVIGMSKEQFVDILTYVYQDPYDFLFMNMDHFDG